MHTRNELEAWKVFLKGRIAQEQGKNEESVRAFDKALALIPGNRHFLNAKSIALAALNRPEEAMAARIAAGYSELSQKCSGNNDKPDPWVKGLEELLEEAESVETDTAAEPPVVW